MSSLNENVEASIEAAVHLANKEFIKGVSSNLRWQD
jgi:hypothetical protein